MVKYMSVVELAIFTPKFKFLVTIALNCGFFQINALKLFQFSGQPRKSRWSVHIEVKVKSNRTCSFIAGP